MARKGEASAPPYGEPRKFDPKFRGPIHNRRCTDVVCCVIFIVVILGYIALGIVAWVHGDPRKVIYPTDSYGQFCGQKDTFNENKTILFYFNILKCASPVVLINLQCPTTQLCVSKCPDRFATYIDVQASYRYKPDQWNYFKQYCKPGFNNPRKSVAQVLRDEDCPSMIIPSRPFLKRCFPDFSTKNGVLTVANQTTFKDGRGKTRNVTDLREAANGINSVLDARSVGMKIFEDYAISWYWILIGLFIAMIVSLLFLVLLRFTAGVLFWIFIFGVIGIIGYGTWHCYWEYDHLKGIPGSDLTVYDIGFQTDFRVYLQLRQTWLAFSTQNSFTRFLLCCLKCCFWCLEKFLKFINRNAYIMIAIYGKNFCTSAKEAFFLLMRNVVRVAVLDKVTDFLLFLGKILVAGGVGVLAFFFFTQRIPVFAQEAPALNYYWVPLLTVIIGSYLVAHGFFSVYAMCVDTLFLCFCEDLERNDGSTAKPYFMSASLHRILGKKELSPKKAIG